MVDYVDLQHVMMVSNRLERFKITHKSPYRINFRCPLCGDSQSSKTKARGWLLENKNQSFVYYCHNCGESHPLMGFLKIIDPEVYKDYLAEKFLSKGKKKEEMPIDDNYKTIKPVFESHPLKKIKKISQLKHDHPVKKYIDQRRIPPDQHYRLFYAPKFKTWINTVLPNKFEGFKKDEPRLILPFLDEDGKIFGVSARGFDPDGLRYITIMFYDDKPKIFGMDKVNFNKPYIVVEGAIDSLFLNNTVAMAGADGNMNGLRNPDNGVLVFDNEPRNAEIHKRMQKAIKQGYKICIWPSYIEQKDINDMVLGGVKDVEKIIYDNSYKGLDASLKFTKWKKR